MEHWKSSKYSYRDAVDFQHSNMLSTYPISSRETWIMNIYIFISNPKVFQKTFLVGFMNEICEWMNEHSAAHYSLCRQVSFAKVILFFTTTYHVQLPYISLIFHTSKTAYLLHLMFMFSTAKWREREKKNERYKLVKNDAKCRSFYR